jgi:hypothetical protein
MGLFGKTIRNNEIGFSHLLAKLFQRNIGYFGSLRQIGGSICTAAEYLAFHIGNPGDVFRHILDMRGNSPFMITGKA